MYWDRNQHLSSRQPLNDRVKHRHYHFGATVQVAEYRDAPEETFERIIGLVRDSQDNARYAYRIREWARQIANEYGAEDQDSLIYAVFDWVRRNMVYVNDPAFNELIHSAEVLMRKHFELGDLAGDCDDYTILICALLLAVGVPCRSRMIKLPQSDGSLQWAHIYPMARSHSGEWIALDATEKSRAFGWEPPHEVHKDFTFA
jgi:transglutaminase-like putative cysteine protease